MFDQWDAVMEISEGKMPMMPDNDDMMSDDCREFIETVQAVGSSHCIPAFAPSFFRACRNNIIIVSRFVVLILADFQYSGKILKFTFIAYIIP